MSRLGLDGFEKLVPEGLPKAGSVLILVPPAEEKDQLAAQFLLDGLKNGDVAVALESEAGIRDLARRLGNMGFDADKAIGETRLLPLDWFAAVAVRTGVEAGVPATVAALAAAMKSAKGKQGIRVVVDLSGSLPDPLEPADLDPLTVKLAEAVKASGALSLFFGPRAHGIGAAVQESFDLVLDLRPLKPAGYGLAVITIGGTPLPRTHMVLVTVDGRLVLQDQKRAEASSASIECPVCKATIPAGAPECPVCRSPRPVRRPGEPDVLDYIEALGQRVGMPEAPLEGGEAAPPEPKPGLETGPAKAPPPRERTGRTNGLGREGLKGGVGRTNGRTNGLAREGLKGPAGRTNGRTNGLTNGLSRKAAQAPGHVNGLAVTITTARKGMTNGLTNGNGFTNGLGSKRFVTESRRGIWRVYLIPIIAACLLVGPLFLTVTQIATSQNYGVDGDFSDWPQAQRVSLGANASLPPSVDLTTIAVRADLDRVYGYVQASGPLLQGSGGITDTYRMFIDADGNPDTGYRAEGLGAEYVASIGGAGKNLVSASLFHFPPAADRDNFSAWVAIDGLNVAVGKGAVGGVNGEDQIEFALNRPTDLSPTATRVLFESLAHDGSEDVTGVALNPFGPILDVAQVSVAPLSFSTSAALLELRVRAPQGAVGLSSVRVVAAGNLPTASLLSATLVDPASPGTPVATANAYQDGFTFTLPPRTIGATEETLQVVATVDSTASGVVGLSVAKDSDVGVANGTVYLTTLPAAYDRAYVPSVAAGVRIDGAYGEWTGTAIADPPGEATTHGNPNVDLGAYDSVRAGNAVAVYAKTYGSVLHGTLVPALNPEVPSGAQGSGTTVATPPAYGLDTLRVFIDADGNPSTGYPVVVGADYMVEIVGRYAITQSALLYSYSGRNGKPDWLWTPVPITGGPNLLDAIGTRQLELLATLPVTPSPQTKVVVDLRDWKGDYDRSSDAATRGMTRSSSGVRMDAGVYSATMPSDLAVAPFDLSGGASDISWTLTGVLAEDATGGVTPLSLSSEALQAGDTSAAYAMSVGGVPATLAYTFGPDTVKEELLLSAPPAGLDAAASLRMRFALGLSRGASMLPIDGMPGTGSFGAPGDVAIVVGGETHARFLRPSLMDADGATTGCAFEIPASGSLDIACPADALRDARYPVRIDPTTTYQLNYSASYYPTGENLGWSVAAGDFNKDGYTDVLTGAPFNDKYQTDAGIAYIYLGPFSAGRTSPDVTLKGNGTANYRAGYAVAAGDFNNDGYSDAAVGQQNGGPTLVYYGRPSWSGTTTVANVTFPVPSPIGGESFGRTLVAANFDNAYGDDLVIGRPLYPSPQFHGRAYLYFSPFPASGYFATANLTLAPLNDTQGRFAWSLAAGKIDSDQKADLIVGEIAMTNDAGVHTYGRISLFKGSSLTGSGTKTPDKTIVTSVNGAWFGYSVAVGNLNGDSYEDVAVGAYKYNGADGRVYLYLAKGDGTGLDNQQGQAATIPNVVASENFGTAVAIGDYWSDGSGDLAVGAESYNSNQGRVYLYDTPLTVFTPDDTIPGTGAEKLGHVVAFGKYSNDERRVLIVGGPLYNDVSRTSVGRILVGTIPEFPDVAAVAGLTLFLVVVFRRRWRGRDSRA